MSSTKVEFYVQETNGQTVLLFACRLIEKIFLEHPRIYVQMDTAEAVSRLDNLLWTFNDASFLPHGPMADSSPIAIGTNCPTDHFDILINMSREFPANFAAFSRIIEFVLPDPTMQQLSRERYRQYRDANCELTTYKIKDNQYDQASAY